MTHLDYGIFDCDTHCYETRDAFTRFLPEAYQDRAIAPIKNAAGHEVLLAGSRIATFNSEAGPWLRPSPYRPGTLKEMLEADGFGQPGRDLTSHQPMQPEFIGARAPPAAPYEDARRRPIVVFPGRGRRSQQSTTSPTPTRSTSTFESFNRWYDETWGFNFKDQLYATALLSLTGPRPRPSR